MVSEFLLFSSYWSMELDFSNVQCIYHLCTKHPILTIVHLTVECIQNKSTTTKKGVYSEKQSLTNDPILGMNNI